MRSRYISAAIAAFLVLNTIAFAGSDKPRKKGTAKVPVRMLSMMPATDGIAVMDASRFFSEAMPRLMSADQPIFNQFFATLRSIETETRIDLRKFDQVAVSVAYKRMADGRTDYQPVVLASGPASAATIATALQKAPVEGSRQETIGGKTVYIFKVDANAAAKKAPAAGKAKLGGILNTEMAVASLDATTVVAGPLHRVRETIEKPRPVSPELTSLLERNVGSVVSFAMQKPPMIASLIPSELDTLGASLDAIRMMYGSMETTPAGMQLNVSARTAKASNAATLREAISDLQTLGKMIFGSSKRSDQQMYGRLISSATVRSVGTDVTMSLSVAYTDVNQLLGMLK
jgi:hypothetical protein